MIHGLSLSRMRQLLFATMLAVGLALGCSSSERYPAHIRYPLRQDLLVVKEPGKETRKLPGPGLLDESIEKLKKVEDAKIFDPADVKADDRKELAQALEQVFGTPARPKVAVDDPGIDALQLDEITLRRGSQHYRRHCMHCHGVAGDGRGPTGPWLNPYPRDYRRGKFKFISTHLEVADRKPRRADLLRVISRGIDGTSMPAFGLLPARELEELASYVTHLSIRGEVEFETMRTLIEQGKSNLEDGRIDAHVPHLTGVFVKRWAEADAKGANTPEEKYPETYVKDEGARHESIRRGYKLFMLGQSACISCHTDFGRQPPYRYDEWGTLVRPNNLTAGVYRGGRRPIDIYWRITGGIRPSGMPGIGQPVKDNPPGTKEQDKKSTYQDAWDLVNFVQALPYPRMLPPDIRDKVYGERDKAVAEAGR